MKNKHIIGKPLPPQFKEKMEIEFSRRFTWKERFQILIGYTATIQFTAVLQHHPGQFTPAMKLLVTPDLQPKQQINK